MKRTKQIIKRIAFAFEPIFFSPPARKRYWQMEEREGKTIWRIK